MSRTQFWIAGAAVLLAVVFVAWKSSRPPQVDTIVARSESVTSTLDVSGVLEAVDRSTVSSQFPTALVKEVRRDIGDLVEVGDVLVMLDDSEYKAQIQAADALIQQADSQSHLQDVVAGTAIKSVQLAQEGLKSVNELRSAVTVARTNRDIALTNAKQAETNLERVQNASRIEQIRLAQAQLAKAQVVRQEAQRESIRSDTLFREGAISRKEHEIARTTLATAAQDEESARQQVKISATPRSEDVVIAESQVAAAHVAVAGAAEGLSLADKALRERLSRRKEVVQAQGHLSTALATKKVSEAERLGALAQRNAALSSLSKTIIRSSLKGRVSQRLVEPGQTVTAGTPLMVLAGRKQLRVRLNVEEASISLLKVGAKAEVSLDAFPDFKIPAVVSEIGSAADFQLGTVEVRLKLIAEDPRLKPELTADANIVVAQFGQVVVVPRSALIQADQSPAVYVLQSGIVKERPVKWAKGNADSIVIRSGLEPGEVVLTSPRTSRPGDHAEARASKTSEGK